MTAQIPTKKTQIPSSQESTLGKTEKLIQDVRKMPIFYQLIPVEAGIGWPIPLRKDGKVYITLPFYGCSPQKGQTILFPPFAILTFNWENLIPVEYVNLRFRNSGSNLNWVEQVGTFPHSAIAQITRGEYLKKRHELLAMYDEMLDNLSQNYPFTSEWNERFSEKLRLLIEPSLEPYYRVLGEKFFERFLPR